MPIRRFSGQFVNVSETTQISAPRQGNN